MRGEPGWPAWVRGRIRVRVRVVVRVVVRARARVRVRDAGRIPRR